MKLKCNDGIVRNFLVAYYDGDRVPNGDSAIGDVESRCIECLERFGFHDTKTLKPLFKAHVCRIKSKEK